MTTPRKAPTPAEVARCFSARTAGLMAPQSATPARSDGFGKGAPIPLVFGKGVKLL